MTNFNKSRILAHRGLWAEGERLKKNSKDALKKALDLGFGLETDVKNDSGVIYISHDIINKENKSKIIPFEELLDYYQKNCSDSYLAVNIKEDGLGEELEKLFKKYKISKYFVFDMSVPELIKIKKNIPNFFVRNSEYENSNFLKSLNPSSV